MVRGARIAILLGLASLLCACARQAPPRYVMIDPATGQQIGEVPPPAPSPYAMSSPGMAAPAPPASGFMSGRATSEGRGLFSSGRSAAAPAAPALYPPSVLQAPGRRVSEPAPAPIAAAPMVAAPMAAAPVTPQGYATAYASAPYQEPYTLDAGDKLRIVVFGQDGLTSSYLIDAGGNVTLPLIGSVPARGLTPQQLAQAIANRLKQGYVRDPKVTAEVEVYRPFFILGEVTTPGQYPFSPNMTAQTAIAIAGGFGPRASKSTVKVTRNLPGQQFSGDVPLTFPLKPGDTVVVKERWF